jgi:hypothetical protein
MPRIGDAVMSIVDTRLGQRIVFMIGDIAMAGSGNGVGSSPGIGHIAGGIKNDHRRRLAQGFRLLDM